MGPHAGVAHRRTRGRAIVGREDDECVVGNAPVVELGKQPAHVRVNVFDHAVELRDLSPLFLLVDAGCLEPGEIRLVGAGRAVVGGMGGIGRHVAEEWRVVLTLQIDPVERCVEEHVGAVALRLHERAVALDHRVEVGVAGRVATAARKRLPDPAAAMDEDAIEPALPRLIGVLITEVPLAEDAGRVAGGFQDLWQRRRREREPLPLQDRVRHARAELVPAGHERRAGRRTGGARVKLGEPYALAVHPVEVRRLHHRIAVGGDVTVALIVGDHVDNVRLLRPRLPARRRLLAGEPAALVRDPVPGRLEVLYARGLRRGEVPRLAAVGREVVEFPGRIFRGDELPVADPHRAVALVAPPQRVVRGQCLRIREGAGKAPTLERRHRFLVVLPRRCDAREFEHRRHHVDHVHGLRAERALRRDPLRPVGDPGRGDPAFVDPRFVPAKRRVRATRPAGPEAQKRLSRAGRRSGIMPLATDHDLRARTVVAREQNERVVERIQRLEGGEDPADLAVHRLDHRCMDRHLRGLELLLLGREIGPWKRPVHLTRTELVERVGLGLVGRPHVALRLGCRCGRDLHALQTAGPRLPHRVPSGPIPLPVLPDQLLRCLERKVRRRERHVVEKRLASMVGPVATQALDGVVANRGRRVEVGAVRQRPAILRDAAGVEEIALPGSHHVERAGKALLTWVAVNVPLARVVAHVAGWCEQLRQEAGPRRPRAAAAPLAAGQGVAPRRLRVIASEQRRPRRPTPRRAVALREPQAAGREPIEVRCVDLAAVAAEIRKAEVVGEDHDDVRGRRSSGHRTTRHPDRNHHDIQKPHRTSPPVVRSVTALPTVTVSRSRRRPLRRRRPGPRA